jgi:hypothetical protein
VWDGSLVLLARKPCRRHAAGPRAKGQLNRPKIAPLCVGSGHCWHSRRVELPEFKYNPDPVATGSIEAREARCLCCGQSRGAIYVGPVFSETELDAELCPWCIADGSAAARFDALFTDDYGVPEDVPEEVVAAVTQRTPGVQRLAAGTLALSLRGRGRLLGPPWLARDTESVRGRGEPPGRVRWHWVVGGADAAFPGDDHRRWFTVLLSLPMPAMRATSGVLRHGLGQPLRTRSGTCPPRARGQVVALLLGQVCIPRIDGGKKDGGAADVPVQR